MDEKLLTADTLYKICSPDTLKEGVISVKGTPSVYINIFIKGETAPTTFSALTDSIGADSVLSAGGMFSSVAIKQADYIGYTGVGVVKVRGIRLQKVV